MHLDDEAVRLLSGEEVPRFVADLCYESLLELQQSDVPSFQALVRACLNGKFEFSSPTLDSLRAKALLDATEQEGYRPSPQLVSVVKACSIVREGRFRGLKHPYKRKE
jgi:hypothetical protein